MSVTLNNIIKDIRLAIIHTLNIEIDVKKRPQLLLRASD